MPAKRLSVVLALSALATACAGIGAAPCSEAEWRAAGYAGATAGESDSVSSKSWLTCAKRGAASADMSSAYAAGRQEGLIAYCTPANGFAEGSRGAAYMGVCAPDRRDAFAEAYAKGRRLFDLQTSAIRAGQAMSDALASLWEAKRRISEIETSISATTTSREERAELVGELNALTAERRQIEARLVGLAEENDRAIDELAAYREAMTADEYPGSALRPTNAAF